MLVVRRLGITALLVAAIVTWAFGLDDLFRGEPFLGPEGGRGVVALPESGGLRVQSSKVASLRPGDLIVAATFDDGGEDLPFDSERALGGIARRARGGRSLELVVERDAGSKLRVRLPAAGTSAWWSEQPAIKLTFRVWMPLLCLLVGAFLAFVRPDDPNALRASLLFVCLPALLGAGVADTDALAVVVVRLYLVLAGPFASFFFLAFVLHFAERERLGPLLRTMQVLAVSAVGVLALQRLLLELPGQFSFAAQHASAQALASVPLLPLADRTVLGLHVALYAAGVARLIFARLREGDPQARRRLQLLGIGCLSVLALILLALAQEFDFALPQAVVALLTLVTSLFPVTFAYVVVRHRIFGIRLILRRGLQYALLSRGFLVLLAGVVFVLLFYGVLPLMGRLAPAAGPEVVALLTAAVTLAIAFALRSLHGHVIATIDRRFFREAYDAEQVLNALSQRVRELAPEPGRLAERVLPTIAGTVHPAFIALYLRPGTAHAMQLAPPPIEDGLVRIAERCEPERALPEGHFGAEILNHLRALPRDALRAAEIDDRELREELFPDRAGLLLLLRAQDELLGALVLGGRLSEEPYSSRDRALLASVAQQLASAFDNARLIREVASRQRTQEQLEIAREVQHRLFPQQRPSVPRLEYSGVCRTAQEVGGDYYDFLHLGIHQLGLAIGDISGKGISAALLMASLQALLRSQAPLHGEHEDRLLMEINRLLTASTGDNRFATFFYAVYDASLGTLSYSNAGHNPPLVLRGRKGEDLIRLEGRGIALGLLDTAKFERRRLMLRRDDLVVFYSDGITEAARPDGEQFGEERLVEVLREHCDKSVETIEARILVAVAEFSAKGPQQDDQTLIVARYR